MDDHPIQVRDTHLGQKTAAIAIVMPSDLTNGGWPPNLPPLLHPPSFAYEKVIERLNGFDPVGRPVVIAAVRRSLPGHRL